MPTTNAHGEGWIRITGEKTNATLAEFCLDEEHKDSVGEWCIAESNRLLGVLPRVNRARVILGTLARVVFPRDAVPRAKHQWRSYVATPVGIELRMSHGVRVDYYDPETGKIHNTVVGVRSIVEQSTVPAYGWQRQGLRYIRSSTQEDQLLEEQALELRRLCDSMPRETVVDNRLVIPELEGFERIADVYYLVCDTCGKERRVSMRGRSWQRRRVQRAGAEEAHAGEEQLQLRR